MLLDTIFTFFFSVHFNLTYSLSFLPISFLIFIPLFFIKLMV